MVGGKDSPATECHSNQHSSELAGFVVRCNENDLPFIFWFAFVFVGPVYGRRFRYVFIGNQTIRNKIQFCSKNHQRKTQQSSTCTTSSCSVCMSFVVSVWHLGCFCSLFIVCLGACLRLVHQEKFLCVANTCNGYRFLQKFNTQLR